MTAAFAALLLRVGQTLLLCGTVRSKNAAGVAVRCVLDLAIVALTLWAVGGVFLPLRVRAGAGHWLDFTQLFNAAPSAVGLLPVAMLASAAVIGATTERSRLTPVLVWSAVTGGVLLPALLSAFLSMRSSVMTDVELAAALIGGGLAAVAFARFVGPRKDKFNRDQSANFVPGHAVVYQFLGLLLTAAGFVAIGRNGWHTLLGGCVGALAGAAFGRIRFGKIDAGLLIVSAVGGLCAGALAAVAPGLAASNWLGGGGAASVLAGLAAGVLTPWTLLRLETIHRVDDVAGLSPAYVIGGTVGLLASALTRHVHDGYATLLALDAGLWLAAAVLIGGLAVGVAAVFKARGALRVSESVEYDGADLAELDVNAYPDFQQTMIKSHHLRQL